MKLVIIESPYKGDVPRNLLYLRSCIRDCVFHGESPYASHRMLTDALDDNDVIERSLGIGAGLAWRNAVDMSLHWGTRVLPVFYLDLGMSDGMLIAKKRYDDEGITYEERTLPADDPFFQTITITGGAVPQGSVPGDVSFCDAERDGVPRQEALRLVGVTRTFLVRGQPEDDPKKVVAAYRGWLFRALIALPAEGPIVMAAGGGFPSLVLHVDGNVLLNGVLVETDINLLECTREFLRRKGALPPGA